MEKSGADVTVSEVAAVWLSAPLVAVIVSGYDPTDVAAPTVTVMTDEPAFVIDVGLKEAVAPVGSPLAARFTVPVKPFSAVIVAVYIVLPPCAAD
jgi:hypothetical protein